MRLLLGRPICQILGGHDWERRGIPVVETARMNGDVAEVDERQWDRIKRMYVHRIDVPAKAEEPCYVSVGVAGEDAPTLPLPTVTMTAVAGSFVDAGDLVTFTGEFPYFACARCGFVEGIDRWDW